MAHILETYFTGLQGKQIAVLGLGVSNRPLVGLLLRYGCTVTAYDKTPKEKMDAEVLALERLGCKLETGEKYLQNLQGELVFRTPGMHPANPALEAVRASGGEVTSEMEVFFALCPCRILAVTGSDGKTTTSTLIAEILKKSGKKVWLGGNIGTPLLPYLDEMTPDDIAVVELSSFQLMDMKHSPHVAVVTNLSPNHLDVHKDMDEYVQAKKNIFLHQNPEDVLIVNGDDLITAAFRGNGNTCAFSRKGKTGRVVLEDGWICRDGQRVLDVSEILIPGVHNIENYMAAILAVEGLATDDVIRSVAREFGGVEHRIELVRIKDGVKFYNDSIASSPSRTAAGLNSFSEKVLLIAGGYDKGISYESLGSVICNHVKKLYLNGATAEQIHHAVRNAREYTPGHPEIICCEDLKDAVCRSAEDAQPGDVVLLSPASAAFDQFQNFAVRGTYFKKLIKEL